MAGVGRGGAIQARGLLLETAAGQEAVRLQATTGAAGVAGADVVLVAIGRVPFTDGLGLDDEGRAVMTSCDVVIHSASTVSFDPPIDDAFKTNVGGALSLYEALRASGEAPVDEKVLRDREKAARR